MHSFCVILRWLGLCMGIIAAGLILGMFVTSGPYLAEAPSSGNADDPKSLVVGESPSALDNLPSHDEMPASPGATVTAPPATVAATPIVAEDAYEQILSTDASPTGKARQLLELVPLLRPEDQPEAAMLASTLVPDRDYAALGEYLTNSATPEPVRQVLTQDLLQRPGPVMAPWLRELTDNLQEPGANELHMVLSAALEEDAGRPE